MANHTDFSRAWRGLGAAHERRNRAALKKAIRRRNRRVARQKIHEGKEALDYKLTGWDVM